MRYRVRFVIVLLATLLCGGTAYGDAIEVDFNSDAFRAAYTFVQEQKGLEYDFAWLHGSEEGDVGSAGLHVLGLTGTHDSPLVAGVGGKLLLIDADSDSGAAAALGGYLQYRFKSLDRLELRAQAYYAPDVLGFSGVESYVELGVRAEYEIHERASVYLGWRTVSADFDDSPSSDVDDGVHIGLRLDF